METIELRGKKIPLAYTVLEMKSLQEEIAPLGDLQYVILGQNKEDETDMSGYGTPEHLTAIAKMIRILGNAGLEEDGQEPELTEKYIMRAIRPGDLPLYVSACMQAMTDGMRSEIPTKEKKAGRTDATLEEIERKKAADS